MKKILTLGILLTAFTFASASADVVGVIDFDRIVDNYAKVKSLMDEMSDKQAEIQRYALDKEREYKKLTTPVEKKNFEESTAREIQRRQEAYMKLKDKKEQEVDASIKNAIKQVAMENKIDTVVEKSVIFYGGVDITDKVVKVLNSK